MMKKLLFLALMMIGSAAVALADDDYAVKEQKVKGGGTTTLGTGTPVDARKWHTRAEFLYTPQDVQLATRDYIRKLTFRGCNPGEAFTRHITVWAALTGDMQLREDMGTPLPACIGDMQKVFDGDCLIPSGGSKEAPIDLLTIEFGQPQMFVSATSLSVVIESMGEAKDQEVLFEQTSGQSSWAESDVLYQGLKDATYALLPQAVLTVATPTVIMTGRVTNQDGKAVQNARVRFRGTYDYEGTTDADGRYSVKVDEGNQGYTAQVQAEGYALYDNTVVNGTARQQPAQDFVVYNAVSYKAGQQASIIMPTAPDASWGRFFRMDRTEGQQLVFERELEPKANVPYVIFPERDFTVDLSQVDLTQQAGSTVISGDVEDGGQYSVKFVGSYQSANYWKNGNEMLTLLDETPDVGYDVYTEGSRETNVLRIGALRAFITKDLWYGTELVFHDETTGLSRTVAAPEAAPAYDLQGRRITSSQPRSGIYVREGRKFVVK